MNIPTLPFIEEGDKIKLTGPVFLSCGCGNVIARWATIQQNLAHKIPQGKPKASKIIHNWIAQEGLEWPELKKHTYGIVVGETSNGLEYVDIMGGATNKVAEKVGDLIRRSNEWNGN